MPQAQMVAQAQMVPRVAQTPLVAPMPAQSTTSQPRAAGPRTGGCAHSAGRLSRAQRGFVGFYLVLFIAPAQSTMVVQMLLSALGQDAGRPGGPGEPLPISSAQRTRTPQRSVQSRCGRSEDRSGGTGR